MDPLHWGIAFEKLLKLNGVKTGSGKGSPHAKDSKEDTVSALAKECGVDPRTARRRRRLAKDYSALPAEEQALVDAGIALKTFLPLTQQ